MWEREKERGRIRWEKIRKLLKEKREKIILFWEVKDREREKTRQKRRTQKKYL